MTQTSPGWYPDPEQPGQQRYWDGTQWTDNRAPLASPAVPKKRGRGCLYGILGVVGLFVVLIVIVAVAAGSGSDKPTSSSPGGAKSVNSGDKAAADQVKITECKVDPLLKLIGVKGTATNTTSKRSNFIIELAITSADGKTQLGTTTALVENAEPGQVAQWDTTSTVGPHPGAVCKVSTVTRLAS